MSSVAPSSSEEAHHRATESHTYLCFMLGVCIATDALFSLHYSKEMYLCAYQFLLCDLSLKPQAALISLPSFCLSFFILFPLLSLFSLAPVPIHPP